MVLSWILATSEEDADVLRRQHVLVEHQAASGNLPAAFRLPQYVLAGADVEILLALGAAPIDEEVRIGPDLARCLAVFDLDIGDQVPGARGRVLGPGHAGREPRDAALQALFRLVEQGQLASLRGVLVAVARGIEDGDRLARPRIAVGPAAHRIAHIVGEQFEPVLEPALVEQPRLAIKKLLDLADQIVTHLAPPPAFLPSRLPSARPSAGRIAGGSVR